MRRWHIVSNVSLTVALLASLVVAITGYLAFRDETESNVLNNLPLDSGIAIFGRLAFAFTMCADR